MIKIIAGAPGPGGCYSGTGAGDGGPATSAQLCSPGAIKLDPAGNLYVLEYQRIRKISPAGIISTVAGGNNVQGFSGDGGSANAAQFFILFGTGSMAVDAAGNVYIGDVFNNRVRKVSPSTATRSFSLGTSAVDYRATASVSGPMAVGYGTIQPEGGEFLKSRGNRCLIESATVLLPPV